MAVAEALGGAVRHRFGNLLVMRIPGKTASGLRERLPGRARLVSKEELEARSEDDIEALGMAAFR